MKANLYLGKVFGMKIKLHWTFYILLLWLAIQQLIYTTNSLLLMFLAISIVFLSVVLHELGHYLVAKKLNIKFEEINISALGGIHKYEKQSNSPKEELLVEIAGLLVNISIIIFLYSFMSLNNYNFNFFEIHKNLLNLTIQSSLIYVLNVNILLLVFNLIPVFPTDAGSILRAILTLKTNRLKATTIVSKIGFFTVLIFVLLGLIYNMLLLFIAALFLLEAYNENEFAKHVTLLKERTVKDAMLTNITTFKPQDYLHNVVNKLVVSTETDFVIKENGLVKGVLYHNDIVNNSTRKIKIKDVMNYNVEFINAEDELSKVYNLFKKKGSSFFPVIQNQKLVGAINSSNLNEYLLLLSRLYL